MMDKIQYIGKSCIQHGKDNNRIYLLKYREEDPGNLLHHLTAMARENGYGKIIAKVPAPAQPAFLGDDYQTEAYIPGFFDGKQGVFFMAKYFAPARRQIPTKNLTIISTLLANPGDSTTQKRSFPIDIMQPENADEMAALYRQVFKTYPFPITDPDYLQQTMHDGSVIYFGIRHQGQLIGLSSAELDREAKNAEMTDFAVLPDYRGQNLAGQLLKAMEVHMKQQLIKTLYTIARLNNPGMNKTFIKQDYHYSGLLTNNTNISGQIESMTVYHKNLQQ